MYAVTGNPRQPPAGNPTAANAVKSTGQEPPLLYSIIGSPRPRIPVQEPPKVASSPVLYAVTGYPRAAPSMTNPTVEPIKKSVDQQPPLLYSVIGSPRRLPMVNSPIATPAVKSPGHEPPLLYSIVASPHPHVPAGSPTKEAAGPIMYSITSSPGSPPMDAQQNAAPARESHGTRASHSVRVGCESSCESPRITSSIDRTIEKTRRPAFTQSSANHG